ncbi:MULTISPECIES: hypothetical protein [Micromonospora]|uniref:GNAT family N-acetyltransferase n=1 Tax=Micromonospora solifontis TaxID=2487138 RepID=A0ABX9WEK6_9ACTN|nr:MULTISPECIES: hypothetical protein [Micromonospora]NES16298.1 hypothetical protein [Micromonospora sp. PPF5-17B]NES38358.1 hypothetical protein [Micromonospora solifontis]NES58110.1 hypothetical protein [Micromonospora sp. PPF5-6]RNL95889.1 hypothetical protein EFE23_19720 [Micromonospora solifontis]
MRPDEIAQALSALPGVRSDLTGDLLEVVVPAIDDRLRLRPEAVRRGRRISAPNGDPAVEFAVSDGTDEWPLIVTPDDVVFAPVPAAGLLDSAVPFVVSNMPPLVAYSEMVRDAEAVTRRLAGPDARVSNLDEVGATFLMLRAFVAGAVRFGLRPVRAVAWWEQGWAVVRDRVFLPPFRADPAWDELAREATRVPPPAPRPPAEPAVAAGRPVTAAEFDALAPLLTALRPDEEFRAAWARWIRVPPDAFARALTDQVAGAQAALSLYPEGTGSVDLRVYDGDRLSALLQLRFSVPGRTMAVDEIRIAETARSTGLFARLMFNAEALARLLGLTRMTAHATDMGSYALATAGVYLRDPELYRRSRRQP